MIAASPPPNWPYPKKVDPLVLFEESAKLVETVDGNTDIVITAAVVAMEASRGRWSLILGVPQENSHLKVYEWITLTRDRSFETDDVYVVPDYDSGLFSLLHGAPGTIGDWEFTNPATVKDRQ